jgi:hypothetical protein
MMSIELLINLDRFDVGQISDLAAQRDRDDLSMLAIQVDRDFFLYKEKERD